MEKILPLQGVRVLDFTRVLAGPNATLVLGTMGAEVIKIEHPIGGDKYRLYPPFVGGKSLPFFFLNKNKKSMTLNLKSEKGREIALKLVERCDVLVENFRPGVMVKLGLGYEDVSKVNPKIIYCSFASFAHQGPYANRPGFDLTASAEGGLMTLAGSPAGSRPQRAGFAAADQICGYFAAMAIMAALLAREKTGKGQKIEVSLLRTIIDLMGWPITLYWFDKGEFIRSIGQDFVPLEDLLITVTRPSGVYKCADGRWVAVVIDPEQIEIKGPKHWPFEIDKKILNNPLFDTPEKRVQRQKEMETIMSDIFKDKRSDEVIKELISAGIACGLVRTIEDIASNPWQMREFWVDIYDPDAGNIRTMALPWWLSESDEQRLPAPSLGQHTAEVLKELGYNEEEIEELRKEGVI